MTKVVVFGLLIMGWVASNVTGYTSRVSAAGSSLNVSVVSSKSVVAINEPFEIGCRIENMGHEAISVLPRPYAVAARLFKIVGEERKQGTLVYKKEVYHGSPFKDDFVELRPGTNYLSSFKVTLLEQSLRDMYEDSPAVHSLYLDFGVSAIRLDGVGTYFVQCDLRNLEEDRLVAAEYGIANAWVGKVLSEPVRLDVQMKP